MRRKINPVILEAIQEDEELTNQYIEAVVNNEKFPFEYKLDLENSNLSNKENNFMNRLALKETKIEGNEIVGAEKLHALKNIFRGIKNKTQKRFQKTEKPKQLEEGSNTKSKQINSRIKFLKENAVDVEKIESEQEKKCKEVYDKMSDEQKASLSGKSINDIQRDMRIDYATASRLSEMRKNSVNDYTTKTQDSTQSANIDKQQKEVEDGRE